MNTLPPFRGPLFAALFAASALTACTDRFDGFRVEGPGVRSDIRIVPVAARRTDEVSFQISPKRHEGASASLSPRAEGAILKIDGLLPLRPDVTETETGYTATFRLPKERLGAFHARRTLAHLHVPTEIGQVAWTGLEHRTPGAISQTYTLVPQQSGPVTGAIRRFFEMLQSLYAAR